jgi:transcriptional regulator with XRE-family HTH domain
MPGIIKFLDYDPSPPPEAVGQRLRANRRIKGLAIYELAQKLGVDEASVGNWERRGIMLFARHRTMLAKLLGVPLADVESVNREARAACHRRRNTQLSRAR